MDLMIKYDHGSMVVHLEEFLKMRSVVKVRKLVKVIQASSTTGCLEQLQQFLEERSAPEAHYQADLKALANAAAAARTREKEQAEALEKAVAERKRYKKKSPLYEEWNEKVKQCREDVRRSRSCYKANTQEFNRLQKEMEFFRKALEIIAQGG